LYKERLARWLKKRYMKTHKTVLAAMLLTAFSCFLFSLTGCDEGGSVSKQEEVTAKLTAATWKVGTVTVDGVDKTSIYNGLTLKFNASGYTATNSGAVWPGSGTWNFTSEEATAIKRNDGLEISIEDATDTSLKLKLTWTKTTLSTGREQSVAGTHVFSFTKQ
jgi:hypothetical protein